MGRISRAFRGLAVAISIGAIALGLALVPGAGAAAAAADRPNSLAAARSAAASPLSTWLHEAITSSADQDWYRFDVARAGLGTIVLGSLPGNYSLALVAGDGTVLGQSVRTGRTYEQISRQLVPGTYFVRVWSADGSHTAAAYALRFRLFAPGVHVISLRRTPVDILVVGELLNNTPDWRGVPFMQVDYLSSSGQVLGGELAALTPAQALAPRATVPFELSFEPSGLPAGVAGFRVTPTTVVVPAQAVPPVTVKVVSRVARVTRSFSDRLYRGTISTTSPQTVTQLYVIVREYDANGVLNRMEVGVWVAIRAHGVASWSVGVGPLAAVNRSVATANRDFMP